MFDTARNLRKSVCVQTQTDFTSVASTKIKDVELPAVGDNELIKMYGHPFSRAMRFLNQETLVYTKRLTFEPMKLRDVFVINETVMDKLGNELLGYSQKKEEELQILLKKNRSPGRRPRSPRRKGKARSQQDQLSIAYLKTNPNYPPIEHMYIQYICELNSPETTSITPKEVTYRKLSCDLYQLMYSMKFSNTFYAEEKECNLYQKIIFENRNKVFNQLFIQIRSKFIEFATKNNYIKEYDRYNPDLTFKLDQILLFLRDYMKEFRPFTDILVSNIFEYSFRVRQVRQKIETDEKKEQDNQEQKETKVTSPRPQESDNQDPIDSVPEDTDTPNPYFDEPEEQSEPKTPEEKRKRFLYHCMCLQLYLNNLQISKQLYQFFDQNKKGYCTRSKLIFAFLNYYKIIMLPSDMRIILDDYIIQEDVLNKTDDLFDFEQIDDSENKGDSTVKINYLEFLKDVVRPYVYEVSGKETFISYNSFMKLLLKSLNILMDVCKESVANIFTKEFGYTNLNMFDNFHRFFNTLLGEGFECSK